MRGIQSRADAGIKSQPGQASASQHDGVVVAGIESGQPRVDVAAQIAQLQIRAQRAQLRLSTQRRGAHASALRQPIQVRKMIADEGICMVGARQNRGQRKPRLQLHRHVFQRMHRAIGIAALHGDFQFLEEQALAANRRQRAIQNLVAAGAQRHQFHLQTGMGRAQATGDVFGLPNGKRAFAGGDAQDGHAGIIACRAAGWRLCAATIAARSRANGADNGG